jgi:gluconolactonase
MAGRGGDGGSAAAASTGGSGGGSPAGGGAGGTSPAATDGGVAGPDTAAPIGSDDGGGAPTPDAPAPPTLGDFPLAAIKAAKAELYVKFNAHLEGPSWRNGEVFFAADGAGGGLMRIAADGKLFRYQPKLLPVGSYLLADGSMLFGDHDRVVEQIFPDGKVGVLASDFAGKPIEFANDVTVDGAGNIYTSGRRSGTIHRISPAGEVLEVASGVNLPNGVEVDPNSKYLYFAAGANIMRLSLPAAGTDFGKPEMVLAGRQPDGMMFDAWGNLWVADWGAGHLVVIGPDGKVLTTVESGGAPINLCPGGKDNDTIFVATDFKGIYKIGPIAGFRGFLHPGAAKYTLKTTLDLVPANTPVP